MRVFFDKHSNDATELNWEEEWHAYDPVYEYAVMPPYDPGQKNDDIFSSGKALREELKTHWYVEIRDIATDMLVWYGYRETKEAAMEACSDYASGIDNHDDEGWSSGLLENDGMLIYVRNPEGKLVYRGTADYYRETFGFYADEDFPVYDPYNAIGHETGEDGKEITRVRPIYRGAGKTEGFTMAVVGPDYLDKRTRRKRGHLPVACQRSRREAGLPEYGWHDALGHAYFPDDLSQWNHYEGTGPSDPELYEYWSKPPYQKFCRITHWSDGWRWELSGGGYACEGPFETVEEALQDFINGSGKHAK